MKNLVYITLVAISASLVSCKKETETEDEQAANAVITLTTPLPLQQFAYGDTVKIAGTITADIEMHGYNVTLRNNTSGSNVLNQGYHEHSTSFAISESWKNTVADTTYMTVGIEAAIDHDGNVKTQQRVIICYPQ